MLVNLQDNDNFASHRLNRDVWVDDTIVNLVESGFLFWQVGWVGGWVGE